MILLRVLFAALVLAQGFAVPPVPTHFVTDNAGAIDAQTREQVDATLHDYQKATGHQIIVWIGQTTGGVPLEEYTGETAHEWKVGRKGYDDGAILFLFMKDHKVRIEVGYGLEGKLTDADAHQIIDTIIIPKMRSDDPNGAVRDGVAAMLTTVTPGYANMTPPPSQESPSGSSGNMPGWAAGLIVAVVFLLPLGIIVLVLVMGRKAAKHGGSYHGWTVSSFGDSGSSSSSSSFDSGGGSDDFDAGGGDFGGGGASGSW